MDPDTIMKLNNPTQLLQHPLRTCASWWRSHRRWFSHTLYQTPSQLYTKNPSPSSSPSQLNIPLSPDIPRCSSMTLKYHGMTRKSRNGHVDASTTVCTSLSHHCMNHSSDVRSLVNIPNVYHGFLQVFSKERASGLPSHSTYDNGIELLPGTTPHTTTSTPLP